MSGFTVQVWGGKKSTEALNVAMCLIFNWVMNRSCADLYKGMRYEIMTWHNPSHNEGFMKAVISNLQFI